jgi:hypothetical protein
MPRIPSLDLARGFTVLFIPAIHTAMLFSDGSLHETLLGKFLIAIAEYHGAQVLMLLMGISYTLQPPPSTKKILIRSVTLLAIGYTLNVLKFSIPYSIQLLPPALLRELNIHSPSTALTQLSSMGDILHFAAIALLIIHLICKCPSSHYCALSMTTLIILFSTALADLHADQPFVNYLLQLATGQPPRVYFPLLPWLVYPLMGVVIGYYVKRDEQHSMISCGFIGSCLLIIGLTAEHYYPMDNPAGFYRTHTAATLWHAGIVLAALFCWHIVAQQYHRNHFFRLLMYSSSHITSLYCIQWVMICWLLPVVGYRESGQFWSILWMLAITINTYLFNFIFHLLKKQYERSINL